MRKVLSIKKLSKTYRIGEVGTGTLSHDLNRWWARIRGKSDPNSIVGVENDRESAITSSFVNVINEVSFDVNEGEVVGIIGRNGAGKSTLLKLISRITSPTDGEIKVKGRIASLLEVGTGMHPEMTARENIHLNGSLLGMVKEEIDDKIEGIVEFAGCKMYMDTPVKRFSSGMRVRLGFAVAAFLEPEILIVDEVLAVGDAEFQKKAIGKMKEVSSHGKRTVLFVSHNMASIKNLCTKVIIIEKGRLYFSGDVSEGINQYMNLNKQSSSTNISDRTDRDGGQNFRFSDIQIDSEDSTNVDTVFSGQDVTFKLFYEAKASYTNIVARLQIIGGSGEVVSTMNNFHCGEPFKKIEKKGCITCTVKDLPLHEGEYSINLSCLKDLKVIDALECAITFNVEDGDFFGTGRKIELREGVLIKNEWRLI